MCGFVGVVSSNREEHIDPAVMTRMTDTIVHRGPDDHGYHFQSQLMDLWSFHHL